jgi:hypothetical protein
MVEADTVFGTFAFKTPKTPDGDENNVRVYFNTFLPGKRIVSAYWCKREVLVGRTNVMAFQLDHRGYSFLLTRMRFIKAVLSLLPVRYADLLSLFVNVQCQLQL